MENKSTKITSELIQAYRNTDFCITGRNNVFSLKIDCYSEQLNELYKLHNVHSSAFITAFNPESQLLSNTENTKRNKQLENELVSYGYNYLHGKGVDPENKWPGEDSFLILDIEKHMAVEIGNTYRQFAIVYAGKDSVPELLILEK